VTVKENAMIPIPQWAREAVHTTACIPCDHVYRDADVTGIGMRHVGDGKVCFGIEVRCPRCHRQELLAVLKKPMDIRAFIAELAELGGIEDYREWAHANATLRFYPEKATDRTTSVHHLHTDGEGWSDPRYSELRLCSVLDPLDIIMKVAGMGTAVGEAHLMVLGGYSSDADILILYRYGTEKFPIHDGMAKLAADGAVLIKGIEANALEPSDWSRFGELQVGRLFKLNGRLWQKMSRDELAVAVGEKRWVAQKPKRKR
jgi:hypothetical protein